MLFNEYLNKLNKLVEKNPKIKNYKVVYAIDEEGNGFEEVFSFPSVGNYRKEDSEFITVDDINDDDEKDFEDYEENAICVN